MSTTITCPRCGKPDHPRPAADQRRFFTRCEHCGTGYIHDMETGASEWKSSDFMPGARTFVAGVDGEQFETTTIDAWVPSDSRTHAPYVPTQALSDVIAERVRQVTDKGLDALHDDEHDDYSMSRAAAAYVLTDFNVSILGAGKVLDHPPLWPWEREWWKPKTRRRNLVRAAALLIAELERMDRAGIED